MIRYFSRYGFRRLIQIFSTFLFILFLFIYIYPHHTISKDEKEVWQIPALSSDIRTHDFRLYPESRSSREYDALQIDNIAESMFLLNNDIIDDEQDYSKPLKYSQSKFRSASVPVIWLDHKGDVHWNRVAQHEMLNYLSEKQFPNHNISSCLSRPLFILEQWPMGLFSRFHCFIEHFGQTLYSPRMTLLLPKGFFVGFASVDDFQKEGILRYYQSISLCSSYLNHPDLKTLSDHLHTIGHQSSDTKIVTNVHKLLEHNETAIKYKLSKDIWKFGYDHVPHRRWLFDRNREKIKKTINYYSPVELLIDHSNEHIYYPNSPTLDLKKWVSRNSPQAFPTDVLQGTTTNLTISDHIFSSFLRYMFVLFFSQLAPRIQTSAKLLAHHWSEYFSDKYHKPYNEVLSNMAALYIRRGDKSTEDSFWHKHKRWRNISMYVKGIIDEEKRREIKYTTIFIMTDDKIVMNSIQEYSKVGLTTSDTDESYARHHLYGRDIIYNVFAPQSCLDPFSRIDFDQFLVNIQFIRSHASFVVGHTDSNVARYLEEIIYVDRQHEKNVQTRTYVINAPDTLD